MSEHKFNLDPFNFSKLRAVLSKKLTLMLFIIILISLFLLVWCVCRCTISNQEIFNVLQGKSKEVYFTKNCVKIYENDNILMYRLSDLLKDSEYYTGKSVANIVFLNFPAGYDKFNDKESLIIRKKVFIKSILPLIIKTNQEILEDSKKVNYLSSRMPKDELTDKDIELFKYLINKYNVNVQINTPWDVVTGINALVVKVNCIPNSIALAIAIIETNWGISKALRIGNSLFSEPEYDSTFSNLNNFKKYTDVNKKKFKTLNEAVDSFFIKMNSHNKYKEFRDLRFRQLNSRRGIDVYTLVNSLKMNSNITNYSTLLKNIIKENNLTAFDKYDSINNDDPVCLYFR